MCTAGLVKQVCKNVLHGQQVLDVLQAQGALQKQLCSQLLNDSNRDVANKCPKYCLCNDAGHSSSRKSCHVMSKGFQGKHLVILVETHFF